MVVTEETIPAEADSGIRRFSIISEGTRLVIQIMQERQLDVPGEVHQPESLSLCNDVCVNEQVTMACVQVAAQTVKHPRLQYLPRHEEVSR